MKLPSEASPSELGACEGWPLGQWELYVACSFSVLVGHRESHGLWEEVELDFTP